MTGASRGLGAAMAAGARRGGRRRWPCTATNSRPADTAERIAREADVARELLTADLRGRPLPDGWSPRRSTASAASTSSSTTPASSGASRRREHRDDDWDEVIEVNLSSAFRLCRAAGRHMIDRGRRGKIINVASLLSFQGGITVPGYAAAKGGIVQLTKALANEWASHGINVNAIAPGYMADRQHHGAARRIRSATARSRERIPAGRWGTPEDLGRRRRVPGVAGVRLRARPRARRRRRLDGALIAWLHTLPLTARRGCVRLPSRFSRFVGPAALTAAGMIGAGAVATRLLAGAWFGFDLLWVALYVDPDGDLHARLGIARRRDLRRARHARHGPRPTSARGWRGRSSCRCRS